MSKGLSASGFLKKDSTEILSDLKSAMKSKFGEGYALENTQDGRFLENISELYADVWDTLEDIYNSFIPSLASDISLSNLVQYNGITRNAETPTSVQLTITGSPNTTYPPGFRVNTTDGLNPYIVRESFTIRDTGFEKVTAESVELGTDPVGAGLLTVIETPYSTIISVTNDFPSTPGVSEEDDEQLRYRRKNSTLLRACGTAQSIEEAIINIEGTDHIKVVENKTTAVDAYGLEPHSMLVIARTSLSGTDLTLWTDKVANAIFKNRGMGVAMNQSVGSKVNLVITDTQGITRSITYNPPLTNNIYVEVNIYTDGGFPTDGEDQIKQAIVDWSEGKLISGKKIGISDDVIHSELFAPIYTVPGHYVNSLFIDTTASPSSQNDIVIADNRLALFSTARITVNIL